MLPPHRDSIFRFLSPEFPSFFTARKGIKNRHLLFKAGADFCYPIMRLNFWRKFGVNSLLRIQKIKQFQAFAAIS